MQNRPDHPTMLEALGAFLMSDVAPKLEGDKALQFRVLIAANLATVVANETRTHDDRLTTEGARLATLLSVSPPTSTAALDALNTTLAAKIRAGERLDDATLEHLLATAKETLAVTNPRFEF